MTIRTPTVPPIIFKALLLSVDSSVFGFSGLSSLSLYSAIEQSC